jgi:hypothetical protein
MSQEITRIEQTLAAYCHRVDRGTPDEVAALFTVDAVLRPRFDGDYVVNGRSGIRDWYSHYNRVLRANVRHMKHMIHSISIEVAGARAHACCYFTGCFVANSDGKARMVFGTYTDTLAQVDAAWLFADRLIETHIVLPGLTAEETFPSLGFPGAQR